MQNTPNKNKDKRNAIMLTIAFNHHGRPKPAPKIIEPRSSMMGSIEQKKTYRISFRGAIISKRSFSIKLTLFYMI